MRCAPAGAGRGAGGDSDTVPLPHWDTLEVGHWERVKEDRGVAYVGVTVGAPLLWVTVTDTQWEVERVGEGGRVPLMVTDRVPLPLPTSVVVLLPLPSALGEKVWVTVQLRDPLPLTVPPLTVAG